MTGGSGELASPEDFGPGTALVVVDVQNDFADPAGSLYVAGGEQVVPLVNGLVAGALAAGAPVVYTQDWHPDRTPHFRRYGGIWPVHCVHDTWGAELHPALDVAGPVVRKGTGGEDGYSGFTARHPTTAQEKPTGLHAVLVAAGAHRIVLVGLAQDYCVKETALDARRLGYGVTVLLPATRPVELEPGDGRRAVEAMEAAGAVVR